MHTDLTGPFNKTADGNMYIIILRCRLTKYIIIKAIPGKTEGVVREALKEEFERYGYPRKLVTDRGREFSVEKLKALLKNNREDAQLKTITPQAPRVNGEAENAMRTIKDILGVYLNRFQNNWDKHLSSIQSVMNSYESAATGYTPNFLFYGREVPQQDEAFLDTLTTQRSVQQYGRDKQEVMKFIWEEVATRLSTVNVDKFNRAPAKRLEFKPYKVDDFVFVKRIPRKLYRSNQEERNYVLSRKLQHRYCGPFRIIEKLSDVTYIVDMYGKAKTSHVINMKHV